MVICRTIHVGKYPLRRKVIFNNTFSTGAPCRRTRLNMLVDFLAISWIHRYVDFMKVVKFICGIIILPVCLMLQEYICLKLCSSLEFRFVIAEIMLLYLRYEYVRYGYVIGIGTVIIESHKTTSMEKSTRSTQEHLEKNKTLFEM